jgi:3-hydroxyisobutyrate dehydrogenase-like beta-hydroxyacid dehydrogenase
MTADSRTTVGLLHPGDMGSAVGATLLAGGARVLWASEGRSAATRARAREVGLDDGGTLEAVVRASRVILSVVPPHGAAELARAVAALGFRGLYVDANAVAPATAREIGRVVEAAGARFVDGGIIGPATRTRRGVTRVYLSGPNAVEVSPWFGAGPLEAVVLDAPPGAASALKMAYAGWNKGSQALLAAIRAFAIAEGVDAALLAEWKISRPDLPASSERAIHDNAKKAWRFVGEMEEIARALTAVGLPPAFHEAAREIFARLSDYKDTTTSPTVEEAARLLRSRGPSRAS